MSKKNKQFGRQTETGLNEVPVVETTPVMQEKTNELYGTISPVINAHLATIDRYCLAMAPGVPVTDTEGAHWNQSLYNAIMGILLADDVQDFAEGMDEVFKKFAQEARGALNLVYTQRFVDKMMVSEEQLNLYTTLLNLISTFAVEKTRNEYGRYYNIESGNTALRHLDPLARERFIYYLNRQ